MRASALGYGVLKAMKETSKNGKGDENLLGEIDVISGVSGGSIPAAYLAVQGRQNFEQFEEFWLKKDVEGELMWKMVTPLEMLVLAGAGYTRSDTFRRYLNDVLFHGKRYADINRDDDKHGDRKPRLVVTATDVGTGEPFPFTQTQFNRICGWLGDIEVARAVTASAAFPAVMAPVRIADYGTACRRERADEQSRALTALLRKAKMETIGQEYQAQMQTSEKQAQMWRHKRAESQSAARLKRYRSEFARARNEIVQAQTSVDENQRWETEAKAAWEKASRLAGLARVMRNKVEQNYENARRDEARLRRESEDADRSANRAVRKSAEVADKVEIEPDEAGGLSRIWRWITRAKLQQRLVRDATRAAKDAEQKAAEKRRAANEAGARTALARKNAEQVTATESQRQGKAKKAEERYQSWRESREWWQEHQHRYEKLMNESEVGIRGEEDRLRRIRDDLRTAEDAYERQSKEVQRVREESATLDKLIEARSAVITTRNQPTDSEEKRLKLGARHLVDGGLVDNLGLTGVVETLRLVLTAGKVTDVRQYRNLLPTSALIVIVDAGRESSREEWFQWKTPGLIKGTLDSVETAMKVRSRDLERETQLLSKQLTEAGIKTVVVRIGFDLLETSAYGAQKRCRKWLESVRTGWSLGKEEREALIAIGGALLRGNQPYHGYVRGIGYEAGTGSTAGDVCSRLTSEQ